MGRWLKTLRAVNGIDQLELATSIGVSRSLVAMWETGKVQILDQHIKAIEEKYPDRPKTPEPRERDKVFELADPGFPASYPTVQMRYAGLVPTSDVWGDPLSSDIPVEVEAKFDQKDRFVADITGSSCFPALQQGDRAIWQLTKNPASGKIVIAQEAIEHGCTVKEYSEDPMTGEPRLVPINPAAKSPPAGEGWYAVALLVGLVWEDDDGTEVSLYRPRGIAAKLLLRLRGQ